MSDLVSIILPVYNASDYLEETLASLHKQTYANFEIIAYDDASTDNSLAILEAACDDFSCRFLVLCGEENKGVAFSRNACLEQASGKFIAFCDSDDVWFPDKLKLQLDAMYGSEAACCHSSIYICCNDMKILSFERAKPLVRYQDQKFRNHIPLSSGLYDCSKLGKIRFEEGLAHEDFQMWNSLLKTNNSIGLQEPLVCYRLSSGSVSARKHIVWMWFIKISIKNFGFPRAVFGFPFYVVNGLRRLWLSQKLK